MKQYAFLVCFFCWGATVLGGYQAGEFAKVFLDSGLVRETLKTHGANLHQKCIAELESHAQHRGGRNFLNTLLQGASKLDSSESIIPSSEPAQNTNLGNQDELVQSMVQLLIVLHNSQAYYLQDQQKILQEINQKPSVGGAELIKIGNQVNQIRDQQKSWIPSTTRELFSTVRTGGGSVVTIISIVGLLIMARYFGFI